jgi:hypothetical protein
MKTQPNQPASTNRLACAAIAVGGCVIACAGCCAVLYVYAFASMVPPRFVVGWERWSMILQKMLLTPDAVAVLAAVSAIGVGVAAVVISIRMALGMRPWNARTISFVAVLEAFVLFLAVLLVISM